MTAEQALFAIKECSISVREWYHSLKPCEDIFEFVSKAGYEYVGVRLKSGMIIEALDYETQDAVIVVNGMLRILDDTDLEGAFYYRFICPDDIECIGVFKHAPLDEEYN